MARGRPLPPGRYGLPWVGEMLDLFRSNHGFHIDRVAKYGPIYKTRLLGSKFVVFSGHEAFHTFATDPRIRRGDADPLPAQQVFLDSVALYDGGDQPVRKTVMLKAVWFRDAIEAYLPTMQELMEKTVAEWARTGRGHLRPDLEHFADRLTGALLTGVTTEEHARELHEVLGAMQKAFMTLPFALPGTTYGRAMKARDRLTGIIDAAIERHRSGEWDDITSRMLAAAAEAGVSQDAVRADLRHLAFTAEPGYSVPLLLVTLALAEHPDVRDRARAEVLAVAPEGPVTMAQLDRLQYVRQVAKELRRYYAMNAATFFGRVTEEMEVGGYRIPKGWGAMGAVHMTLRNPDEFPQPDVFDPDRFEPAKEAAFPPGRYVPHGDGPPTSHRCPGEDIVTVAVQLYLVVLLRRLDWTLPAQDLTLTNEIFPVSAGGLLVDFTERDATA
ncbi:MAG: cytochrome P450 [Propionicimonas sp.]|uniref:cytochrome P450 n=1 Tax=Propionicimonas sp. TaxID=1955623 RepID=UPI003D0F20AF